MIVRYGGHENAMGLRGRPRKDNPRDDHISFRAAEDDLAFRDQVSARENIKPGTAAWKIYQCGKRFYFAECSHDSANDSAPANGAFE
jgi:hypothetical protein